VVVHRPSELEDLMNANELASRLQLPFQGRMPTFDGANGWLNTAPLTAAGLGGNVVAVDFWTYTCINWLRTLPYLRAWADAYREHGLVMIGVHTPEFGVEHDVESVRRAARDMDIRYPIAIDNDYAVWNAFGNQYWPALYLVDAKGRIRHHALGEGGYERAEHVLRKLLEDAGADDLPAEPTPVDPHGIEVPADWHNLRSPETYVGFARSQGFASPEHVGFGEPRRYTAPSQLRVNEWALDGDWTVGREEAASNEADGRIAYRFHARDLHLILAPTSGHDGVRFRVLLDGVAPGDAHGLDVDEEGNGVVAEARLHQLIRQPGPIEDRQFEIEFLDPGVAALCFTFG
jgi:thiol-disulfide isomerase/thioredoxin